MRITRIGLIQYGTFTDRTIDIGPGLTVIVGPNESGKSTLRDAVADILWGIAGRSHPRAFGGRSVGQLKLTASLTESNGEAHHYEVTKKGYLTAEGAVATPWWIGGEVSNRAVWTTALGVDRDELIRGGRQILRDGGDLHPLLFRARTGVNLAAIAKAFEDKANALYKRHANNRSVEVRKALDAYEQARKVADSAVSSAATVEQLRQNESRAKTALDRAKEQHDAATEAKDSAEEVERAWAHAQTVQLLQREIEDLASQGPALDTTALASYEAQTHNLNIAKQSLSELEEEFDELRQRLEASTPDSALLAFTDRIDTLITRESQVALDRKDLEDLLETRTRLRSQLRHHITVLAPESLVLLNDEPVDDDEFITAAKRLLLPNDVLVPIDHAAENLLSATKTVHEQQQRYDKEQERLDLESDAALISIEDLSAIRSLRDSSWRAIRDPWLTGNLPDAPTREQFAVDLDRALLKSDEVTHDSIRNARTTGADAGRREVLQQGVATAKEQLDRALDHEASTRTAWEALVAKVGLPQVSDAASWQVRKEALADLQTDITNLLDAQARSMRCQESIRSFEDEVAQLGLDAVHSVVGFGTLKERFNAARAADARRVEINQQLRENQNKRTEKQSAINRAMDVLRSLTDSHEDLEAVALRSANIRSKQIDLDNALAQLQASARPGTNERDLIRRAVVLTEAQVKSNVETSKSELHKLTEQRDAANQDAKMARVRREEAEVQGEAAHLNDLAVQSAGMLWEKVDEYLEFRFAASIVHHMAEREGANEDASLIANASSFARQITGGRVQNIEVDNTVDSGPRLILVAEDLYQGTADELSEGTADQVFLSLRLAGIREQQDRSRRGGHGELPVVLDDVLMGHDDKRTRQALGLLVQESRDQQILLTTHHRAVAEQARQLGATVVEL